MDIRIYNHLLMLLGAFCMALLVSGCGSTAHGIENYAPGNSANAEQNSVALNVAVPNTIKEYFCARFEVSAADMSTIIVKRHYPARSTVIDAVLTDIKAGTNRELVVGIFEARVCGELDDADWVGKARDIPVNAGDTTRVMLNLVNVATGDIIASDQFENYRLQGEVLAADGTPIPLAKCEIFDNEVLTLSTTSKHGDSFTGVLDAVVSIHSETDSLAVACDHQNFNRQTAVAGLHTNPDGYRVFRVTVVMQPDPGANETRVNARLNPA